MLHIVDVKTSPNQGPEWFWFWPGGGGHSGMVWLAGAVPPWGAVAVGGTVRLE